MIGAAGLLRSNLCDKNAKETLIRARYFLIVSKDFPIAKYLFIKPYIGAGANYTMAEMDYKAYDYKHDYSGLGASATAGVRAGYDKKDIFIRRNQLGYT